MNTHAQKNLHYKNCIKFKFTDKIMHSTIPHGQTDDAKIRAISAYSLTYEIRPAVTKSTKSMLVKPMTTSATSV